MLTNVIGFFANMLPIKTIIDESQMFLEYLKEFKSSLIACLAHDEATYEDLVGLGKSSSGCGYFKHLFAPGGMSMETVSRLDSKHITTKSAVPLPNGEEQCEFLLTIHPSNGHAILRFDNHLFMEEAACQFLEAYISLVEMLRKNPESKIQDILVVSESEQERLIKELSLTAEAVVKETCLHHLVEEQVQRTMQFTAVKFESEFLMYMELNSMANHVARSLIQQGVHAGNVVALCFDRGVSQIISVLAVLKAGGVFVPLDLDDPTL